MMGKHGPPRARFGALKHTKEAAMKIRLAAILLLALPAAGATHKDAFPVPCGELWAAVEDTLRNSGKYDITAENAATMTASYKIGGDFRKYTAWPIPRDNSVTLTGSGNSCQMITQSHFTGLVHDDAGDFLKRVRQSLVQKKAVAPAAVVAPPSVPVLAPAAVATPPSRPVLAPVAPEPACRNIVVDKSGHRVSFD
jgi:hypothetical protein